MKNPGMVSAFGGLRAKSKAPVRKSALEVLEAVDHGPVLDMGAPSEEGYVPIADFEDQDEFGTDGFILQEIQRRGLKVQLANGKEVFLVGAGDHDTPEWLTPQRVMQNLKVKTAEFGGGIDFVATA